jgi:membrane protease YdiL (CAAX protease family)
MANQFPLTTFVAVTFAFTWALLPFASASVLVSLVALCGPAVGAIVTAALMGKQELSALGVRIREWRVPRRWYLFAALAPLVISLLAAGIEFVLGAHGPVYLRGVTVLEAAVFVLVIGEEIGWRGFALPLLLRRTTPWRASLAIGLVWGLWHLPLFRMEGMPQYGSPFGAYLLYTCALSVLLTFLALRTSMSVVIATLFHGAVNAFGFSNASADASARGWGNAIAYGAVAIVVALMAWRKIPK